MLMNLSFYIYTSLFFFLDIIFYGLLQKKIVHLTLCFYSIYVFHTRSNVPIIFLLLLITLEGFLDIPFFGAQLIYLLPITFLSLLIRYYVQSSSIVAILAILIFCLFCNYALLLYLNSIDIIFDYGKLYELIIHCCLTIGFLKLLIKKIEI